MVRGHEAGPDNGGPEEVVGEAIGGHALLPGGSRLRKYGCESSGG
jgi:hypothetical protein